MSAFKHSFYLSIVFCLWIWAMTMDFHAAKATEQMLYEQRCEWNARFAYLAMRGEEMAVHFDDGQSIGVFCESVETSR